MIVVVNAKGEFLGFGTRWHAEHPDARCFESVGSARHAAREAARRDQRPTFVVMHYGLSSEHIVAGYTNGVDRRHAYLKPIPRPAPAPGEAYPADRYMDAVVRSSLRAMRRRGGGR